MGIDASNPQVIPLPQWFQLSPAGYRVGRTALAGFLLFMAAGAVTLAGLSLRWPLIHDAAVMQYVGWLMHQGAVPYRDVFDMNFPGTHLVHWLVLCIPGDLDFVWRCFDLTLLVTTLVLLAKLLPPRHYWAASATCVAFALYYLGLGPFFANGERDMMMTPLLLGGVVANIAMLESAQPRARLAFVAGVLFGAACTIKPTGVAMAVLQFGFSVLWLIRRGQSRGLAGVLAAAILGMCLPGAAILAWLHFEGGLPAFLDIELHYLPIYSSCYTQCADWTGWWRDFPFNVVLGAAMLSTAWVIFERRTTVRFTAITLAAGGAWPTSSSNARASFSPIT